MTPSQLTQLNLLAEVSCGFVYPRTPNSICVICADCRVEEWCFSAVWAASFVRRHEDHKTIVAMVD